MSKSLIASKPILKQTLENILLKAAYEAQNTMIHDGDCPQALKTKLEADMKEGAMKWAKKFSEEAGGPMADAIYDFVKEISIVATVKGTLIAPPPSGPVTGVINPTDFKII